MPPRTSNANRARDQHARHIEAAVNEFSPRLWAASRRLLQAWLRRALTAARDPVQALDLKRRLWESEKASLAQFLADLLGDSPPEDLLSELGRTFTTAFAQDVASTSGFLTTDPRLDEILQSTTEMLEDDLSEFWRSLTSPETLATRLVNLKAQGLSYVESTNAVARQYGTEFYRAERLVRSTYNTSANAAHYRDMVDSGFETKTWLSSRDARVRRPDTGSKFDHSKADGQTVPIDKPFVIDGEELMFPGDRSLGASAGNVVNCRCTTIS